VGAAEIGHIGLASVEKSIDVGHVFVDDLWLFDARDGHIGRSNGCEELLCRRLEMGRMPSLESEALSGRRRWLGCA
jgi:hypothetical protein